MNDITYPDFSSRCDRFTITLSSHSKDKTSVQQYMAHYFSAKHRQQIFSRKFINIILKIMSRNAINITNYFKSHLKRKKEFESIQMLNHIHLNKHTQYNFAAQ